MSKSDATVLYETYCESKARTEVFERVANNTIFASSLPSTTNHNASESSTVSHINSPTEETGALVKGFGRESNVNIATVSVATFLNFLIHVQNGRDGTSVENVTLAKIILLL